MFLAVDTEPHAGVLPHQFLGALLRSAKRLDVQGRYATRIAADFVGVEEGFGEEDGVR